jgi:hypothetical protein
MCPCTMIFLLVCVCVCVCEMLNLNSGLALARQALYHLSPAPSLIAVITFQIGSHVFTQARLDHDSPPNSICRAGVTDVSHQALLIG